MFVVWQSKCGFLWWQHRLELKKCTISACLHAIFQHQHKHIPLLQSTLSCFTFSSNEINLLLSLLSEHYFVLFFFFFLFLFLFFPFLLLFISPLRLFYLSVIMTRIRNIVCKPTIVKVWMTEVIQWTITSTCRHHFPTGCHSLCALWQNVTQWDGLQCHLVR